MKKQLLFIAIAICSLNLVAQTVPSYVPTNGLVGWWPFNGNANDESGNGNNGTVNGATLASDRNNNMNSCYSFSGNNQNITIPNSNSLNPNNITINLWMVALDSNISVIAKINPNNASNFAYQITHKDEFQGWHGMSVKYGGANCNGSGGGYGPRYTIPNNIWSMITVVIHSNGNIEQYLNSVLSFTLQGTQSFVPCNDPTSTLRFGGQWWNNDPQWFKGKLDDIGIWGRALTQQEITALYNGCSASTITSQPTNQNVVVGNTAQFMVSTSGSALSYQWQQNSGTGFSNLSNFGQFSGVTTNTLTISNVSQSQNNFGYRCIINNGGCSDTTDVALLNITLTGINEIDNQNDLLLFPNPTKTNITINTSIKYSTIKIVNLFGQLIIETSNKKTIDVSLLQNGVYFIQLFDEKQRMIKTEKFIKE